MYIERTKRRTDSRRRLVEDEQLALAHDGSRKRNDLPLSNGQVAASTGDLSVERDPIFVRELLKREEASGTECIVQRRVIILAEHIEIVSERSAKELGLHIRY